MTSLPAGPPAPTGPDAGATSGGPGGRPGRRRLVLVLGAVAVAVAVLVGVLAIVGRGDREVPVADFGAVGDGVADDGAALQQALDTAPEGGTLVLRDGATYRYSQVLTVSTPGLTIEGAGATLEASDETASALKIVADDVTVTGLTLTTPTITQRWDPFESTMVWVAADSAVLRDVHVRGAGGAGIAVTDGAGDFLLDRVTVTDSRADGIHITDQAHDGRVVSPVTTGTGDDGVAVVSYMKDGGPSERITIESPTVNGTTWGRGVSVVGGNDITYTDVTVRDTDAAGIYVGSEGDPYFTYASVGVLVDGGTVTGANTNADKDHGAVLVYAGNDDTTTSDVTVRDLTISGTRPSSPWDVGVLLDPDSAVEQVTFEEFRISEGPAVPFYTNDPAAVRLTGIEDDGAAVPDQGGW
ncbi:glycosyl hydrolase family 28-related protein [Modestobacter italicus]|uniref:glycosyl hydrolase family 28-related protein n=1 Tax=Modestobacter italicus (strain DSM 44449 / CECT 9708 / BC 501) TaxID=2732864 RepID=UPI001C97D771|nr:right-handed parallel beta-helix repeat-containing protein [Modestobacter italicus]